MRRRVTIASSVLVFLTLAACPSVSTGAEAVVRFDRQCAQKDIAVMVLIETHADIGELAPSELAGAWETLLDARTVCSEGRVSEALALYQTVLDLGPPRAFLRQVNAHRDAADRSRR